MARKHARPARPQLTPAQTRQLVMDARTKAFSWGGLLEIWMSTLADAVDQVSREGEAAPFATRVLMWIRLYGTLDEVLPGLKAHAALLQYAEHLMPSDVGFAAIRANLASAVAAVKAIRGALSSDELLFVAFARHHEAHPFPHLDVTQLRRGALVETRQVFGVEHGVKAIADACERVFFAHGGKDPRVAAHLARRLLPLVHAAADACRAYAGAR